MQMPPPIRTYFTARAPQDGDALAAAFADDAVVHDEGRDHHGPRQIRDWWLAAEAKYRHHAEPIDMTQADGRTIVRATVTGDFPGSPIVLNFHFQLQSGSIQSLEIKP